MFAISTLVTSPIFQIIHPILLHSNFIAFVASELNQVVMKEIFRILRP